MQTIKDFFMNPDNSIITKILAGLVTVVGLLVAIATLIWTAVQIYAKIIELREKRKSKKKPPVAINLPLRNQHFAGRNDTFTLIKKGFSKKGVVTLTQTVAGLGGVGKSQTVLEYAHRHLNDYTDAVWWIDAETSLQEDCRKLLVMFGFKSDVYDERVILAELGKWYRDYSFWLLIFDNADDYDKIKQWIPANAKGHVLITSRDKNSFRVFTEPIDLDVFSEEVALDFFQERTKQERDGYAKTLVNFLGRFPLALEQAAAYMLNEENELSYSGYQKLLEKKD